ncbi:MAG: type III ribulose-bisphosphate carboxylase [Candidatus Aenigmatarchaeota archaeon]
MSFEWYTDFVNTNYTPKKTDIKVLFYFEPAKGITVKEAAGRIASESSAGTWTTLSNMPKRIKSVMATAYDIRGNYVKIAYPGCLWDKGNAPQLLSGIAGNIFGMKALNNLRLIDVELPADYIKHFRGPQYGIQGLRKMLHVKKRPITGAVPKPKIGFSAAEHAEVGYETWMGGFELLKDDENLTTTSFNRFEERIRLCARMRDKAEKETGDRKSALLNITGPTHVMIKRAKMLHNLGWEYAMIDVVTAGAASVQTMREICQDYHLAIHAHRAMHASFDRNPKHGISMLFLAKLMRLIGVDQIHVGTVVGKLVGSKPEVMEIEKEITSRILRNEKPKGGLPLLHQNWGKIKPVLPVSSGGVHPGIIPDILDVLGTDICLLVSGGIHGHPKGTRAGAKAAMQAIEAHMAHTSLEEYAKNHRELAEALEKWGHKHPR